MADRRAGSNQTRGRTWARRRAHCGLVVLLLFLLSPPHPHAQTPQPAPQIDAVLASMTVEERIGQLFLVAFVGSDAGPGSDIARLVEEDRVGGVVLLASNSNFRNDATTPRQVAELANRLQALAMAGGAHVPLFVAVDHEGDIYPYTRITGGTTPLPNAMAIGATWQPENARAVGQITGLELAAMGINLLLGPGADVLANPRPDGQGDIGTRTFGGDPWWVGQMGRAYIAGLHEGSGGRVATVAKHFPGHGGSDRLPDEEVATVDKALDDLTRVELAPFMAVTNAHGDPDAVTDALMSSHIRYRGFQRNVRQFTAPISFDAEAMRAILDLAPFATWRATGLMVSDSLGVPAVRKYFDPTLTTFPHRRIAKEAFLAGNDVLLLAQFALDSDWPAQLANIRDAVTFFQDEYRRDPAFATRVDEAVRRILAVKLGLYPEFTLEAVEVYPDAALQVCGLGGQVTQRVATQALTLIYPDPNAVPPAPRRGEKIVIFTDARSVRECFTADCQPFSPLTSTAVEEAILSSFGPDGTGQVDSGDIASVSFGQLKAFLNGEAVETDMATLVDQADWIILAQQDLNPVKGPNSDAGKLFLSSPLGTASDARLVVLAFNAPYYLDTTEISKLDLYLGAYAKTDAFVQVAVRALFGEVVPAGASPVDVVGINYDLERQLAPDPQQVIPLVRVEPAGGGPISPPVEVKLLAGPVLDRNGHPVPDGTDVILTAIYDDGSYLAPVSTATKNGMAEGTVTLSRPGRVEFRAASGDASESQVASVTLLAPATLPPDTPSPTPQAPVQPTATPPPAETEAVASPSPTPNPGETEPAPLATPDDPPPADGIDLLLAASAAAIVGGASGRRLTRLGARRRVVIRMLLLVVLGATLAYLLYTLDVVRIERWGVVPGTVLREAAWIGRVALIALVLVGAWLPVPLFRSAAR
ncbi:MAG: hypothetical protein JXA93_20020 [Anaerolineae bacterium]|nr:hypothetical protein [Anaerolineae bacterium]